MLKLLFSKLFTSLTVSATGGIFLLCVSAHSSADDAFIFSGLECLAVGKQNQTSALNTRYLADGSIANQSATYTTTINCPLKGLKEDMRHIKYVAVNFTNGHSSRNTRCNLYVDNYGQRKVYTANSLTGIRSDVLILENTDEDGVYGWLTCNLPPKSGSKMSTIHSYQVEYENEAPSCNDSWFPLFCFDPSGVPPAPRFAASALRFERKTIAADPYVSSSDYVTNYSEHQVLPVVFPLVRDNLTENIAPFIKVKATLKTDNISLARCRLFQSDGNGNPEIYELEWTDSDDDGVGEFRGTGNLNSMTNTTIFTVQCDIPPKSSLGTSKLSAIIHSEY